ncbi:MAG TPA: hypothetical protein VH107_05775 [Lacipirellulaceae bacterium]|nr:hypothetical protein [Lacipirellulaceae bacterium]
MKRISSATALMFSTAVVATLVQRAHAGTPIVPGTGEFLKDCCDDFEDPNWSYRYNFPKSSYEQDEEQRAPGGRSNNGLWHEGGKRGTPDVVRRVSTPPGGIEGSTSSLMFATCHSGIPGTYSNQQQQDDLLMLFNRRLGRTIPMNWQPSATVRVYLPEWDKWEQRTGASFGMRCDCQGRNPDGSMEEYWPGMFLLYYRGTTKSEPHAQITCRGDRTGHDVRSVDIKEPGWWTMGMSFSADGQIHYYAHKGVADLTKDDYLMSSFPYNEKCVTFDNFFFNVANWDDGHTWSTPWVIDDPKIYAIPPEGQTIANLYRVNKQQQQQMQKQQQMQMSKNRGMQQPESVDHSASASREQMAR